MLVVIEGFLEPFFFVERESVSRKKRKNRIATKIEPIIKKGNVKK